MGVNPRKTEARSLPRLGWCDDLGSDFDRTNSGRTCLLVEDGIFTC